MRRNRNLISQYSVVERAAWALITGCLVNLSSSEERVQSSPPVSSKLKALFFHFLPTPLVSNSATSNRFHASFLSLLNGPHVI